MLFRSLDMPLGKLTHLGDVLGIRFFPEYFVKEFAMCLLVHNARPRNGMQEDVSVNSNHMNQLDDMIEGRVQDLNIEGLDSGVSPSNGSLACIIFTVTLVTEGKHMKELLESSEEFEFEIGTGAVIPLLEGVVTQMSVGQSASYYVELPPQELLLAAAHDSATTLALLSSREL